MSVDSRMDEKALFERKKVDKKQRIASDI